MSKFFISIFFGGGDGWGNNIFHDTAKFFHELTLFKIALLCLSVAKFIPSRISVSKRWLIVDCCQILKGHILQLQKQKTRNGFHDINKKKMRQAILNVWLVFKLKLTLKSFYSLCQLTRTSISGSYIRAIFTGTSFFNQILFISYKIKDCITSISSLSNLSLNMFHLVLFIVQEERISSLQSLELMF